MTTNLVRLSPETKAQLDYLSKATNISRKRLLKILIEEIYTIGANYSRLTLDADSSVLKSQVIFSMGGKSKMEFKTKYEVEQN